jgi:hypothetical protein
MCLLMRIYMANPFHIHMEWIIQLKKTNLLITNTGYSGSICNRGAEAKYVVFYIDFFI